MKPIAEGDLARFRAACRCSPMPIRHQLAEIVELAHLGDGVNPVGELCA